MRLSQRQKEDRLLDSIANNRNEILRYLSVALIGEVILYFVDRLIGVKGWNMWFPLLHFLIWGSYHFFAVKLFVRRQKKDDVYVWMMQGMKFTMCFIVILLLCYEVFLGMLVIVLPGRLAIQRLLVNLVREALYWFADYKIIFKKKN